MQTNVNQEGKERIMTDDEEKRKQEEVFPHGGKPEERGKRKVKEFIV